ncbi:MAG: hypothetical protein EHM36_11230 [Deltaproteobacteria bacterium]|nr:MAG: hypothetical protein EHM36_11230 [Deltaproteobacteria bacterium]
MMINKRRLLSVIVQIIVLLTADIANAWVGEPTFLPIQREIISRLAGEMIDFSWSPTLWGNPLDYSRTISLLGEHDVLERDERGGSVSFQFYRSYWHK